MTASEAAKTSIRLVQYRDLEAIEALALQESPDIEQRDRISLESQIIALRRWFGLYKVLSLFPNPLQYHFCVYVAEAFTPSGAEAKKGNQLQGVIRVSPFNISRTTWRVEQVMVDTEESLSNPKGIASQLLRYCFESIWEVRTWILEVNIQQKNALALYRQQGFQPLAEITYWSVSTELLAQLAEHEADLPNLLPVSNAEAPLLYQLDCVSMPPLLRQVFDRHLQDFKTSLMDGLLDKFERWYGNKDQVSGYVFEPQRKAAIGYFKISLCKDGSVPHAAKLTVHPAYTWLYPKLLIQMAHLTQKFPPQSLELLSADYQHERREYLEKLGATRVDNALLMSRSVWHKLREVKPESTTLSEVLQGLKAVPRTPIPSRLSSFQGNAHSPNPTQGPGNNSHPTSDA
jgi:hypothetical protein